MRGGNTFCGVLLLSPKNIESVGNGGGGSFRRVLLLAGCFSVLHMSGRMEGAIGGGLFRKQKADADHQPRCADIHVAGPWGTIYLYPLGLDNTALVSPPRGWAVGHLARHLLAPYQPLMSDGLSIHCISVVPKG